MYQSIRVRCLLLCMVVIVLAASCNKDSNPVGENELFGDHADAVGCVVFNDDVELARSDKGEVTGQLEVKNGQKTPLLTVKFIAEDGDLFQPEGEHYTLNWEVAAADIAAIEQSTENGKWRFQLAGKKVGTTGVVLKIFHGDHADFVANTIPIKVTE